MAVVYGPVLPSTPSVTPDEVKAPSLFTAALLWPIVIGGVLLWSVIRK